METRCPFCGNHFETGPNPEIIALNARLDALETSRAQEVVQQTQEEQAALETAQTDAITELGEQVAELTEVVTMQTALALVEASEEREEEQTDAPNPIPESGSGETAREETAETREGEQPVLLRVEPDPESRAAGKAFHFKRGGK